MSIAAPAFAQRPLTLRGPTEAAEFCNYSAVHPGKADEHPTKSDEAYDAARRRVAQRPVEVIVNASSAPVIAYDRVTGALEVSLYQSALFADGYAFRSNIGAVGFELPEAEALKLRTRYEAGNASLKLTFLPLAWSDYERQLCRKVDGQMVLDGDVLTAQLVDELGRPLATYRTQLGREVALMRQHRIKGYLNSGTPVITVSALSPFGVDGQQLSKDAELLMKSRLRAALYGCYLKGLTDNGRLQGALVVKMTVGEATVLVDSLHDPLTRGCALERMAALSGDESSLKATVIFRLEEAPSL